MNHRLSPSSLNLLEDCPRCFWLDKVKGIKRPAGAFPSLPSGVDRILKAHFDRFMAAGQLPPELRKEGIEAKLFSNKTLLDEWRNNRRGIRYKDGTSEVTLMGAVDNLLEKEGKLIVLDFKTRGFALKPDTHHHYQDQLNIYNFLLRKNGYRTENYTYLLFYMPEKVMKSGEFIFETKLVKMKVNTKHALELFQKAIGVLRGRIPESSVHCKFCKWEVKRRNPN